ncbi:shikimate dehydrogenase [Enemella sp. A6]|uniref:shikimate dehydrogenase n=1 Tax=Enemella sp. A6 TaxID=3440152 RepID=UPI003EBA30E5
MRRCAVLGSPISHSLSPVLHRAAYAHLGLHWEYEAIEVAEGDLAEFVAGLDHTWRGLSLTMPLKVEALTVGDEISEVARLIGAGNTMVFESGCRLVTNTDAFGLTDALSRNGVERIDSALILGGGATARSSLVGLAALGARQVAVSVRTPERIAELSRIAEALEVTLQPLAWDPAALVEADVCVSTVTAGAADDFAEAVADRARVVFEVLYEPWPTRLVEVAEAVGRQVLGGLDLLVGQAVRQVRGMTGLDVPAEVLLAAGQQALNRR